jgi:hypothetical protein
MMAAVSRADFGRVDLDFETPDAAGVDLADVDFIAPAVFTAREVVDADLFDAAGVAR